MSVRPVNRRLRWTITQGAIVGALLCLMPWGADSGEVQAQASRSKIDVVEQARTVVVRSSFTNEFSAAVFVSPAGAVGPGATLFSGHAGPYALPGSGDIPVTPNAGGIVLVDSALGAPMAEREPYPGFIADSIHRARQLLYMGEAGGNDLVAAFRFVDMMYGVPENVEGWDPADVVNLIEGRFSTMADMYGAAERLRATEAERILRRAMAFAPTDAALRQAFLDLLYNRVRAETILAKEKLVATNYVRLEPPPPTGFVVDEEIAAYEGLIEVYKAAPRPYFELLQDRMGLNVQRDVDPGATGNAPFGYHLFQREVPGRSLFAATYRTAAKSNPIPVLDQDGDGQPDQLLTGYKDLVLLLEVLRDHTICAGELAKRYVLRNLGGDIETARALIRDMLTQSYVDGTFLLGMFPELGQAKARKAVTGLPEQIQSWRHAMTELDAVNGIINGENNILGFQPDFLMLVQGDGDFFDSYDALASWNDPQRISAPIRIAMDAQTTARDNYDAFRGTLDQLFEQYDSQIDEFNGRLLEIVGATPGQPEYATPFVNPGSELSLQVQSIQVAQLQIQKNQQEIENLQQEILIEIERRGIETGINNAIASVHVVYGNVQASLTKSIATINAEQASAQNDADAAASVSVSAGFPSGVSVEIGRGLISYAINGGVQFALEKKKGNLEAQKERVAALQNAQIVALDDRLLANESRGRVKTLLLRMSTLALESQSAAILLAQEWDRLTALVREKEYIENSIDESNVELIPRYYADPVHRLRFQSAAITAENAFTVAQKWLFFMVRAFEYKWNAPFMFTEGARTYSLNDVFRVRNAAELFDVQTALERADMEMEGFDATDDRFDWFSFRQDFLSYQDGGTYADPITGADVDAMTAFRSYLKQNTDAAGILTLEFDTTAHSRGTFFTGPIFHADGTVATPGLWNDKIRWITISVPGTHPETVDDTVLGVLTYGGTSLVRKQFTGILDPARPDRLTDEMTAWSTRYWFKKDSIWQFKDSQSATVSINVLDNPLQPLTVNQISVFKERSVAASEWTLKVFLEEGGVPKIFIDDITDIELYFYHQAKDRIEAKHNVIERPNGR